MNVVYLMLQVEYWSTFCLQNEIKLEIYVPLKCACWVGKFWCSFFTFHMQKKKTFTFVGGCCRGDHNKTSSCGNDSFARLFVGHKRRQESNCKIQPCLYAYFKCRLRGTIYKCREQLTVVFVSNVAVNFRFEL